MYESLNLVDPDSNITIDALLEELQRFYAADKHAPKSITGASSTITLRWPDYEMVVTRERLPNVLEESQEIAGRFGTAHEKRERIALCDCRFVTRGDDDPDMLHFNDYLFIGEALERLGTVYRFDQSACEFS